MKTQLVVDYTNTLTLLKIDESLIFFDIFSYITNLRMLVYVRDYLLGRYDREYISESIGIAYENRCPIDADICDCIYDGIKEWLEDVGVNLINVDTYPLYYDNNTAEDEIVKTMMDELIGDDKAEEILYAIEGLCYTDSDYDEVCKTYRI